MISAASGFAVEGIIRRALRMRPLDFLASYIESGALIALNGACIELPNIYAQVKRAADYASDCIDGLEVFHFHRQRKFRRRRYEFAIKVYAENGHIVRDAIEVAWSEIALEDLLAWIFDSHGGGAYGFTAFIYDDEFLQHGTIVFSNGRLLDFRSSVSGKTFVVAMIHGAASDDHLRAEAIHRRMVILGEGQHVNQRVLDLVKFIDKLRSEHVSANQV